MHTQSLLHLCWCCKKKKNKRGQKWSNIKVWDIFNSVFLVINLAGNRKTAVDEETVFSGRALLPCDWRGSIKSRSVSDSTKISTYTETAIKSFWFWNLSVCLTDAAPRLNKLTSQLTWEDWNWLENQLLHTGFLSHFYSCKLGVDKAITQKVNPVLPSVYCWSLTLPKGSQFRLRRAGQAGKGSTWGVEILHQKWGNRENVLEKIANAVSKH